MRPKALPSSSVKRDNTPLLDAPPSSEEDVNHSTENIYTVEGKSDATKEQEDPKTVKDPTASSLPRQQTHETTQAAEVTPSLQSSSQSSNTYNDDDDDDDGPLPSLSGTSDSLKESDVERQNELHQQQNQEEEQRETVVDQNQNSNATGKQTMSPWHLRSSSKDGDDYYDDMQTNSGEMEVPSFSGNVEFVGIPKTVRGRRFFVPRQCAKVSSSEASVSQASDFAVASESDLSQQIHNSQAKKKLKKPAYCIDPIVDDCKRLNPFCFHDAFRCLAGRKKTAQDYAVMNDSSSSESIYTDAPKDLPSKSEDREKSSISPVEKDEPLEVEIQETAEPVQFLIPTKADTDADLIEPAQFSPMEQKREDEPVKPALRQESDKSAIEPVPFPVLSNRQENDETTPGAQLIQALTNDPTAQVTPQTSAKALEIFEQKMEALKSTRQTRKRNLGTARDELRDSLKNARQLVKLKVGYEMARGEISNEINATKSDLLEAKEERDLCERSQDELEHTKAEIEGMNQEWQDLLEDRSQQRQGFTASAQQYEEQNEAMRSSIAGLSAAQQEAQQLQTECDEVVAKIVEMKQKLQMNEIEPRNHVLDQERESPDGAQTEESKLNQRIEVMRREMQFTQDAQADTQQMIDSLKQQMEERRTTAPETPPQADHFAILSVSNTSLPRIDDDDDDDDGDDELPVPESLQILRSRVRAQETNAQAEVYRIQKHRIVSQGKQKQLQSSLKKSHARVSELEAQLKRAESARAKRLGAARRSNTMRRQRQTQSQKQLVMSVCYPPAHNNDGKEGPKNANLITNDKLNSLIYSKRTSRSGRMGVYGQLLAV